MRNWVIVTAALALSGCWTGPDFYAGVPSAQPIEPGRYKITRVEALLPEAEQKMALDEPIGQRVRIGYDRDGLATIETSRGDRDVTRARLVSLDPDRNIYVIQYDPGQGMVRSATQVYGLVQVTPRGYRLGLPPCDGTRRLRPGSPVIVSGVLFGLNCSFRDRASFETAMRDFADDPTSYTEYTRVRD